MSARTNRFDSCTLRMNICIFGDSITWGSYDPDSGGWCNLLRNHLEKINPDVSVYNLGICGDTSTTLLKRIAGEAARRDAGIIVIAIGTYDYSLVAPNNENWVSKVEYENNLKQILIASQNIAKRIIFMGLTPVDDSKTQPLPQSPEYTYLEREMVVYSGILKRFCESKGVEYIGLDNIITSSDLSDGLHPNSKGHKKIFGRVKKRFEILISQ